MQTSYETKPSVEIQGWKQDGWNGFSAVCNALWERLTECDARVLVVECYPGVREEEIIDAWRAQDPGALVLRADDALQERDTINTMLNRYLTDDRVFGQMAPFRVEEFQDQDKIQSLRARIEEAASATSVLVIGFGASAIALGDVLVYADLSRWEIQLRYRSRELANWQADNHSEDILRKYKRGYFVEWRVADKVKRDLFPKIDFYLDTHRRNQPVMITGSAIRDALLQTAKRPFRLVPYFDPGVWGGHWLESHIELPPSSHPYAWGFDGVPEENSLFVDLGRVQVEVPAINLVFEQPKPLLGESVYARFGAEFPIRFDFLDTIGGQNLSLQVHPVTDYIQRTFGMHYTQDESYYMLDADPGATVYLGLKDGVEPAEMMHALSAAETGETTFDAEKYVNRLPAKRHDHFSIPAGTVHCSGAGSMVLEISATPYIFTFKLWDWGRLGLDGKPRPVHLEHGFRNIQWDRNTTWVHRELLDQVELVDEGEGWREERTGLHALEFLETRRHWFRVPVTHSTHGSVNMLNLVEGQEATVESLDGTFDPFVIHYAETFIVPASVERYVVRPSGPSEGQEIATIKAFVRTANCGMP